MTGCAALSRRHVMGGALASMLSACGGAGSRGPRDPGTLTILGYGGPFEISYRETVIAPFEQAHPGIRVDYRRSANSAQSLAALRLQQDRPEIDIAIMDIAVSIMATQENLLSRLDEGSVPNLGTIPSWARISHGPAITRDNLALLYNPSLVPAPTSWRDLARPVYEGQICLPIADTRGVILLSLLSRIAGVDYRRSIDPGIAFLRHLAPAVATWTAQPDIYTLVRSGSAAIGVGWNGRGQMLGAQTPEVLASVIPREGSTGQVNTINLAAASPHQELGRAFIDHALSVAAQRGLAAHAFYAPTNRDVSFEPDLRARIFGQGADTVEALDWGYIAKVYNPWIRRIQREVISD